MDTEHEGTSDSHEPGGASGDGEPVSFDVRCHRCAYNLRGLPDNGRCPECGGPIAVSVAGDALEFADPEWLMHLERGARWTMYTVVGGLALAGVGQLVCAAFDLAPVATPVAGVLAIAAFLLSTWWVSTPNPSTEAGETWNSPRRLVRYAVIGAVATLPLSAFFFLIPLSRDGWLWTQLLGAPFGLLGVIGAYGLGQYCRELALRAGDTFVAGRAHGYLFGYVVSWIVFGPSWAIVTLTGASPVILLLVLGSAGVLGFGVLSLHLPGCLAQSLIDYRRRAEEIWHSALQQSRRASRDPAN